MSIHTPEQLKARVRRIDLLAAVMLLAVIGGTIFGGVLPMYNRTKRAEEETFHISNELSKLDGLSHTLSQLESELTKTQARLTEAEARFPSSTAQDQFMVQVAKVAEDAGLTVEAIAPKPLQDGASYRIMPFQITGTGSFETCYKFLTGLRKMGRLTRLDDLVLQLESTSGPADKDAKSTVPTCRVSVGLSTFVAR